MLYQGEKKVQLKASLLSGNVGAKMEVSDDKLSASLVCNEVRFAFYILLKWIHKGWDLKVSSMLLAAWGFLEVSNSDSIFLNLSYFNYF